MDTYVKDPSFRTRQALNFVLLPFIHFVIWKGNFSSFEKSFFLDYSVNVFDYLGGILSYICIAPLVFSGHYDHLTDGELTEEISKTAFVVIYLVNQFTKIFDQMKNIADVIATGQRICEMTHFCRRNGSHKLSVPAIFCMSNLFRTAPSSNAMEHSNNAYDSDAFYKTSDNRDSCVVPQRPDDTTLQITGLSIDKPKSDLLEPTFPLISNLTVALRKSENLMIRHVAKEFYIL